MQQRLPSLLPRPILFAHRGARAYAPENTIAAFELALRLGATGLESDVWVTADRIPVLDHDGEVRRGRWKKQPIAEVSRADLPDHIPTLAEMIDHCGREYQLSLDLKDEDSGALVVATIRHHFPEMMGSTWLCHHRIPKLIELRPLDDDVKLVDSTRLSKLPDGPERHAATLAQHGIDAVNMRGAQWNGGLTSLYHRFERAAFGWDLQQDYQLETAIRMGLDGVYSDYVDRMADAAARETPG